MNFQYSLLTSGCYRRKSFFWEIKLNIHRLAGKLHWKLYWYQLSKVLGWLNILGDFYWILLLQTSSIKTFQPITLIQRMSNFVHIFLENTPIIKRKITIINSKYVFKIYLWKIFCLMYFLQFYTVCFRSCWTDFARFGKKKTNTWMTLSIAIKRPVKE